LFFNSHRVKTFSTGNISLLKTLKMKKTIVLLAFLVQAITSTSQVSTKRNYELPRGSFGGDFNYMVPVNSGTNKPGKTLFTGNAASLGIFQRAGLGQSDRLAILSSLSYRFGKTNKQALEEFAQDLVKPPFTFRTRQSSESWSELHLLTGTSFKLANRLNGIMLEVQAGVVWRIAPRTITIDQYDSLTLVNTVYEETEKQTGLSWRVGGCIPIPLIKGSKGKPRPELTIAYTGPTRYVQFGVRFSF
jgi:hypothetical protein